MGSFLSFHHWGMTGCSLVLPCYVMSMKKSANNITNNAYTALSVVLIMCGCLWMPIGEGLERPKPHHWWWLSLGMAVEVGY